MKAIVLSAAGAAALASSQAAAHTLTLGGPLAVVCYESAQKRDQSSAALETCSRALSEESLDKRDRSATLVNRGIIYMIRGQAAAAEADFDFAAGVDPTAPDPWLNKAFLRLRQGEGRQALELLDQAIQRRGRRPALTHYARGMAYEQMGNFRAAYADLNRARALEPSWAKPAEALARYRLLKP